MSKDRRPSKQVLFLGIGLSLLLGIGLGFWISTLSIEKTVYVDSSRVFSDFKMTQELNTRLSNTQETRQVILDSLELRVRQLSIQQNARPADLELQASLGQAVEELRFKSDRFQEDNQRQLQTYQDQIWKQLNQYIGDFREMNGYAYVLGATGSGNLMAANPSLDITNEIIAFVNQRYEGN